VIASETSLLSGQEFSKKAHSPRDEFQTEDVGDFDKGGHPFPMASDFATFTSTSLDPARPPKVSFGGIDGSPACVIDGLDLTGTQHDDDHDRPDEHDHDTDIILQANSPGSRTRWSRHGSENSDADPDDADTLPRMRSATRGPEEESIILQKPMFSAIALNNCDRIIPNLYLGGMPAAEDTTALLQNGFRAVCCCCREQEFPDSRFCQDLEYYRVDVEDMSVEPIELFWPEATEFIHSWVSREQPVLVHCRAGVSRSASVVIAYLMEYQGYSLHDAFFLTRSHRSVVTPNIGFMEKLGDYEENVSQGTTTEPTIEINKYIAWFDTQDRAAVPDLKPE